MTIEHLEKVSKNLKKHTKNNAQKLFFCVFFNVIFLLIGGLVFFYIEHCSHSVKEVLSSNEWTCQLCNKLNHLKSKYVNHSDMVTAITNVTLMCETGCNVTIQRECKLDRSSIFQWFEYAMSIATTIGEISKNELYQIAASCLIILIIIPIREILITTNLHFLIVLILDLYKNYL